MNGDDVTLLFLEPRGVFDAFMVGILEGVDCVEPRVVYDKDAIIKHLIAGQREAGADEDEAEVLAVEHFDFNIAGAWVGEQTPLFVSAQTLQLLREMAGDA